MDRLDIVDLVDHMDGRLRLDQGQWVVWHARMGQCPGLSPIVPDCPGVLLFSFFRGCPTLRRVWVSGQHLGRGVETARNLPHHLASSRGNFIFFVSLQTATAARRRSEVPRAGSRMRDFAGEEECQQSGGTRRHLGGTWPPTGRTGHEFRPGWFAQMPAYALLYLLVPAFFRKFYRGSLRTATMGR